MKGASLTLTLKKAKLEVVEYANNVDLDEAAHNELAHLDFLCLFSSNYQYDKLGQNKLGPNNS